MSTTPALLPSTKRSGTRQPSTRARSRGRSGGHVLSRVPLSARERGPVDGTRERTILRRFRVLAARGLRPDPSLSAEIDALFAGHRRFVHDVCTRFVGDRALAEDLAQETLLVAWRRLADFEGRSRFSTWCYEIARRVCRRSREKAHDLLTVDGVVEARDPRPDVIVQLWRGERLRLVRAAAADLDPTELEAVRLRYGQDASYETITVALDLSGTSGARGLLQRCRRHLVRSIRQRLVAPRAASPTRGPSN